MTRLSRLSNQNILIFTGLVAIAILSAFIQRTNQIPLQKWVIGDLIWEGNERFDDEQLLEVIGIAPGDPYDQEQIKNLFNYSPKKNTSNDISSFYMDQGHLFFSIEYDESKIEDEVDITFKLFEGPIVTVSDVRVKGIKAVPESDVLDMINIRKGELFNRSKLIAAQLAVGKSGLFNPEKVVPIPIPNPTDSTVEIVFEVEEL